MNFTALYQIYHAFTGGSAVYYYPKKIMHEWIIDTDR